jgi:hypothetical protein
MSRQAASVVWRVRRKIPGILVLSLITAVAGGCEQVAESEVDGAAAEEAVEIWTHPDTVGIEIRAPIEMKSSSRSVVWGLDQIARAVMRFEPSAGDFGVFGLGELPPVEVRNPARMAVTENSGIFVYDATTRMVDLYTPGGQFLRGFDPGYPVSILEASSRPMVLTLGTTTGEGDEARLTVIQTDYRGQDPDTLLSRDKGPEPLRQVVAVGGRLAAAPSLGGLWLFSADVPDTVFEVTAAEVARRLVLPESDSRRVGLLADIQQQVLWVVAQRPRGGLYYEAFDVSSSGDEGIIAGVDAYLGTRTTPLGFTASIAYDGVIQGWLATQRGVQTPQAYDMRMDALRMHADSARAVRDHHRQQLELEWEMARQEQERMSEEVQPAEP